MDEVRTGPVTLTAPPSGGPDGANGAGADHADHADHADEGGGTGDDTGAGGQDGGHPPGTPPYVRRTPSAKPALIVVGIAALLLLLFGIAGVLGKGTAPPPKPHKVAGAGLRAMPAASVMAAVLLPDTPPPDILGALVVPRGSITAKKPTKWNGATQFTATVHLKVAASQAQVITFFTAELKARTWSVLSTGPAGHQAGAIQLLAQKGSSDSWYWEVGITADATTFVNGGRTDLTAYSVELFEVAEAT
jgi:hypothetical protein